MDRVDVEYDPLYESIAIPHPPLQQVSLVMDRPWVSQKPLTFEGDLFISVPNLEQRGEWRVFGSMQLEAGRLQSFAGLIVSHGRLEIKAEEWTHHLGRIKLLGDLQVRANEWTIHDGVIVTAEKVHGMVQNWLCRKGTIRAEKGIVIEANREIMVGSGILHTHEQGKLVCPNGSVVIDRNAALLPDAAVVLRGGRWGIEAKAICNQGSLHSAAPLKIEGGQFRGVLHSSLVCDSLLAFTITAPYDCSTGWKLGKNSRMEARSIDLQIRCGEAVNEGMLHAKQLLAIEWSSLLEVSKNGFLFAEKEMRLRGEDWLSYGTVWVKEGATIVVKRCTHGTKSRFREVSWEIGHTLHLTAERLVNFGKIVVWGNTLFELGSFQNGLKLLENQFQPDRSHEPIPEITLHEVSYRSATLFVYGNFTLSVRDYFIHNASFIGVKGSASCHCQKGFLQEGGGICITQQWNVNAASLLIEPRKDAFVEQPLVFAEDVRMQTQWASLTGGWQHASRSLEWTSNRLWRGREGQLPAICSADQHCSIRSPAIDGRGSLTLAPHVQLDVDEIKEEDSCVVADYISWTSCRPVSLAPSLPLAALKKLKITSTESISCKEPCDFEKRELELCAHSFTNMSSIIAKALFVVAEKDIYNRGHLITNDGFSLHAERGSIVNDHGLIASYGSGSCTAPEGPIVNQAGKIGVGGSLLFDATSLLNARDPGRSSRFATLFAGERLVLDLAGHCTNDASLIYAAGSILGKAKAINNIPRIFTHYQEHKAPKKCCGIKYGNRYWATSWTELFATASIGAGSVQLALTGSFNNSALFGAHSFFGEIDQFKNGLFSNERFVVGNRMVENAVGSDVRNLMLENGGKGESGDRRMELFSQLSEISPVGPIWDLCSAFMGDDILPAWNKGGNG